MNTRIRVVLGFLVTALFVYLAVRDVDFAGVGHAFAQAKLIWAVPAALCVLTGYLLRSLRWQALLAPSKRIPFGTLFSTLMLGFAANNVLPARVGEVIRAHQIGRKAGISRSLCFSTIIVERVLDGLTLIAFMAVVLALFPIQRDTPELRVVEVASAIIFLGAALAIAVLLFNESLAMRLAGLVLRRLPANVSARTMYLVQSVLHGLHALRSGRHLVSVVLLSVVVWSLEASGYFFVLKALEVPLVGTQPVLAAMFLVVFVNLGIMIPSAPGYLGTFQLFAKMALGAFAVEATLGFSVAILAHAIQYFLVTGIGLIVFLRNNVSVGVLMSPVPAVGVEPRLGEPTGE